MPTSFTHRLAYLQHELDTADSFTASMSLLLSIRRELTRLLQDLPPAVRYALPSTLRSAVQQSLAELTAPARELLTAQAHRALAVLERLAQDYDLTLPPFPTIPARPEDHLSPEPYLQNPPYPPHSSKRRLPAGGGTGKLGLFTSRP